MPRVKVIGLLGGMSWESTVPYYQIINRTVRSLLGGHHSARIVLYSVDFAEIEKLQHEGRWKEAGAALGEAARSLERAGAEFIVLCTNTMHIVAGEIGAAVKIPILHIADRTVAAIKRANIRRVGLLATRFTMEEEFYRGRLSSSGLEVLVPPRKTALKSIGSFTTSSVWDRSGTARAKRIAKSFSVSSPPGPRGSSSAALRSCCSSVMVTRPCRRSIRPTFTRGPPRSWPFAEAIESEVGR